jgi:hypothetical protein
MFVATYQNHWKKRIYFNNSGQENHALLHFCPGSKIDIKCYEIHPLKSVLLKKKPVSLHPNWMLESGTLYPLTHRKDFRLCAVRREASRRKMLSGVDGFNATQPSSMR